MIVIPNFWGVTIIASTVLPVDTAQITVRQPNANFIETYKLQKEFIYTAPPLEANLLQRIYEYLKRYFNNFEDFASKLPFIFKILMWGMILFFLFLVITKTKIYKMFYTDKVIETPYVNFVNAENNAIDFDAAIATQVTQKQYRNAIRLLYIKGINGLRDKEYIHFSKEKTNVDYLNDLSNEALKQHFQVITSIYNHVWYGQIEIAETTFATFETRFQTFYAAIYGQE